MYTLERKYNCFEVCGTHVRAAKTAKILHHIINRACLADEIAEPRPDMNIKVTTFTESNKFNYIDAKVLL